MADPRESMVTRLRSHRLSEMSIDGLCYAFFDAIGYELVETKDHRWLMRHPENPDRCFQTVCISDSDIPALPDVVGRFDALLSFMREWVRANAPSIDEDMASDISEHGVLVFEWVEVCDGGSELTVSIDLFAESRSVAEAFIQAVRKVTAAPDGAPQAPA